MIRLISGGPLPASLQPASYKAGRFEGSVVPDVETVFASAPMAADWSAVVMG